MSSQSKTGQLPPHIGILKGCVLEPMVPPMCAIMAPSKGVVPRTNPVTDATPDDIEYIKALGAKHDGDGNEDELCEVRAARDNLFIHVDQHSLLMGCGDEDEIKNIEDEKDRVKKKWLKLDMAEGMDKPKGSDKR